MMLGVIRYAPPTFPPYSILTTVKNANILIPTISVGGAWTHKNVLTQGANTLSVNKRHTRQ